MDKPYVVSADICLLMEKWATQHNFISPQGEFFRKLRKKFSTHARRIFPGFELISEDEISCGLADLATKSGLPSISLDRVYFQGGQNLEIARLVDERGENRGLGHRAGAPSLAQQIKKLQMGGIREVVVVDDVIFTGELLERIIDLLSRMKIRVPLVCAGIGIAEGIRRINVKREIHCVRTYEEVVDEVCERDFYPGVPLSGRLLVGDGNIGAPYILPFGNPVKWASIPAEWQIDFSRFCIKQTIVLFEEIERLSRKTVGCKDLERKLVGLPNDNSRFVDFLRRQADLLGRGSPEKSERR